MGIDPGLGGGVAILHPKDGILLEPMPIIEVEGKNKIDIKELNRFISSHARDIRICYLEQVPIMGKNGSIALFKLGQAYGIAQGVVVSNDIHLVEVRPQAWMKIMHAKVSQKIDSKERSRMVFSKLFPHVDARRNVRCTTPDMGMVEAALIADYGRRDIV